MSLFAYIKQQVPIMDEVSRYVQLKPAGNYHKGPCPFHRETDASFTVSPDKQIFYCFGCHVSGDVVSFVAKAENLTQIEAARYLVESYKLTVPAEVASQMAQATQQADEKANYFALCKIIAQWAAQQLKAQPHAYQYVRSRHISDEIIARFGIGYMPGGNKSLQALIKECARHNILVKDLIAAGILFESRTTLRSPYEERIVFPITDTLGRHCGFGGRIFVANDERAKYYNSKESPFFVKGSILFGYALAKKEMQERKSVFLVEGYTDCVALAQHGYSNVVATLGTACTLEHLQLLARTVDIVYVLYDGDAAGHKAMLRMAQLCWQVNLELRVVQLPGALDPAAYLQEHASLSEPLAQAQDIFTYFVHGTAGDFENKTLADKMRAVDAILAIIIRVPDMVKRELLLQLASKAMRVPVEALRSNLAAQQQPSERKKVMMQEEKKEAKLSEHERQGLQVVALSANSLLHSERIMVPVEAREFFPKAQQSLLTVIDTVKTFEELLSAVNDAQRDVLLAATTQYSGQVSEEEFFSLISKLVQQGWKEKVQVIRQQLEQARHDGDTEKTTQLVQQFAQLKQSMQQKGLIWQKKQQKNSN